MLDAITFAYMQHVATYARQHLDIQDFEARLANFAVAHNFINATNEEGNSWVAGHNQFSDFHAAEYKQMLGYVRGAADVRDVVMLDATNAPASVNWVDAGAVTPVKDQGQCGSCWAFSSTGAMEGAHFLASGELLSFSEQQLVDCAYVKYGNYGCSGGLQDNAYKYYAQYSPMLESDYSYTGTKGSCAYDASKATTVAVTKGTHVAANDKDQMKAALAISPLAVAIEADKMVFQTYKSGVLDSTKCGTSLDHAVLAVGYGTEDGQDYWLVKNSWNTTWGDNGYIKLAVVDGEGICGVQEDAEYASTN